VPNWSSGAIKNLEYWSDGVLEYWKKTAEVAAQFTLFFYITPTLQYSITPVTRLWSRMALRDNYPITCILRRNGAEFYGKIF
jgi:hypothetical protein